MDWYCLKDPYNNTVVEFKGKPLYVSDPSVLEFLIKMNEIKIENMPMLELEKHVTWNLGFPKERGLYVLFFQNVIPDGIRAWFGGKDCSYILSYFNGTNFTGPSSKWLDSRVFLGWQKIEEFSGRYL